MLGQAVTKEVRAAGLEVVEISRSAGIRWNYFESNFDFLAEAIGLDEEDVLVNCVGWIPQKKSGSIRQDEHEANALNVELIREIQSSQDLLGFRWVQIVTDCVYSGGKGLYSEESTFDPVDLYGATKSIGETLMPGAMRIRASIVGPDRVHRSGLYEWFRNQASNSRIQGYRDHLWNGVSTKAFGRLVSGLCAGKKINSGLQHWVPLDSISKHELLLLFRFALKREDVYVEEIVSGNSCNRSLATSNPEGNLELWAAAGYERIPSIEALVSDFIRDDLEEEH